MPEKPFIVTLKDRGLIHLEGEDRHDFLQGLISNDITLLKRQPCFYTCLLTPNGKFLHDFFVIEGHDYTLLDCEGDARAADLFRRLNLYRLRKDVQISLEEHNDVYAIFGSDTGLTDPRHPDLGRRSFEKPDDMPEEPFNVWDEQRIKLGIPDGSRDMVLEKSTLLECNIDKFHGISFDKGCYMGQELTARMHYRGLAKKHLYSVSPELLGLSALPAPCTPLEKDGRVIGDMRSSCGDVGLALMKDALFENLIL